MCRRRGGPADGDGVRPTVILRTSHGDTLLARHTVACDGTRSSTRCYVHFRTLHPRRPVPRPHGRGPGTVRCSTSSTCSVCHDWTEPEGDGAGGGPQVHIFPPIKTVKGDFDEEKVWEMAWTGLGAELTPDSVVSYS